MNRETPYGEKSYAYIMDKSHSIDIDDKMHFLIAETIMKKTLISYEEIIIGITRLKCCEKNCNIDINKSRVWSACTYNKENEQKFAN